VQIDEIARKLAVTWHKMSKEEQELWVKQAKGHGTFDISQDVNQSPRSRKRQKKENKTKESKSKPVTKEKKDKVKKGKKGSKAKEQKGPAPKEQKGSTSKEQKGPTPKEQKGPTPKEQKGPKTKKERQDLTKPKRPVTAYIFFSQKVRPDVKAKNPHLNGLGVTKFIGEMWNKTNKKEREPFLKIERESRQQYQIAMEEWRRKQSNNQQDRVNKKDLADKKSKPKANKLEAEKEVHPEDGKTSDNERETKTDVQSQVQQDVHAEVEVNASPCADNTEVDIAVEEANLSNPGRQVYMANPAHDLQTNFSNLLLQRVQMPFILSRGVDLPHVMARMQGGNITGALPMLHLPAMQAYFLNQGHPMQRQMGSFSRSSNQSSL